MKKLADKQKKLMEEKLAADEEEMLKSGIDIKPKYTKLHPKKERRQKRNPSKSRRENEPRKTNKLWRTRWWSIEWSKFQLGITRDSERTKWKQKEENC